MAKVESDLPNASEQSPSLRVLFLGIDHDVAGDLAALTTEPTPYGTIVPVTKTADVVHTLKSERYDCVVVGGALGHHGGLELVTSSLSDGATELPPIIVIGDADDTDGAKALAAGAADWLGRDSLTPTLVARAIGFAVASRSAQNKLNSMKLVDPVTGLVSEALFWHLLEHGFERAKRNNEMIAVLAIYLAGIGDINDNKGWDAGDDALRTCALRLRGALRSCDVIARLPGAKLVILVEAINDVAALNVLAEKIADTVSPAFEIEGQPVSLKPMIGIAAYPHTAESPITLVRCAVDTMDAAVEAEESLRFA